MHKSSNSEYKQILSPSLWLFLMSNTSDEPNVDICHIVPISLAPHSFCAVVLLVQIICTCSIFPLHVFPWVHCHHHGHCEFLRSLAPDYRQWYEMMFLLSASLASSSPYPFPSEHLISVLWTIEFSHKCHLLSRLSLQQLCLLVSHGGMNDRGSTCKFRNARIAFQNLHVDPLSFIPPWETNFFEPYVIESELIYMHTWLYEEHLFWDWILLVCFSWRYEWQRVHV